MSEVEIDPARTILFAGAGISQSLGLPSWGQLIDEIGVQLGFDPRVFRLYGDYLSLAEYYLLKRGSIGALRSWMDTTWHDPKIDIQNSKLHRAIVEAGFRKIYTTNFDRWIEKACEKWDVKYRKVLTVSDLASVRDDELEVVKFHGDFDDDSSLVLTESHYQRRLDFQGPLDIALRADVLRYSVLFIGYSLTDINTRYLFKKLSEIWNAGGDKARRPKNYIYMMQPNPIAEAVFDSWGITAVQHNAENSEDELAAFVMNLKGLHCV